MANAILNKELCNLSNSKYLLKALLIIALESRLSGRQPVVHVGCENLSLLCLANMRNIWHRLLKPRISGDGNVGMGLKWLEDLRSRVRRIDSSL